MPSATNFLAQVAVDVPVWSIAALIVIVGLFVYGLKDVRRLSLGRIWAISGVCFRDAIRRRVLWVTPLAMLGVIIVVQLQKPLDEQDAIRLTTKFCFFATALVVTIVSMITAATNLPREIENRVVYTIVTKPVTRLEIVLGKITGFARVSAAILVVMGVFSLGYLHLRAWTLGRQITDTLATSQVESASREWLTHYQETGLLVSRHMTLPESMNLYAKLPEGDQVWLQGGGQYALARFPISQDNLPGAIALHVAYEALPNAKTPVPAISLRFHDPRDMSVMATGQDLGVDMQALTDPAGKQTLVLGFKNAEKAAEVMRFNQLIVAVTPDNPEVLYGFQKESIGVLVADASGKPQYVTSKDAVQYRGSSGRLGQQLRGPDTTEAPVAVFRYDASPTVVEGRVPFELLVGVERSGDESETETPTMVEVAARDLATGKLGPATWVYPESNRTVFFSLPAADVPQGPFDLVVRNRTNSHVIAVAPSSISLVTGQEYFGFNVFKGLLVLWLFSILVSTIAFFCSTWLSWPIAVVVTLLMLVVRWGVTNFEIGASSGIGGQVAQEFAGSNAGAATVLNNSVEGLIKVLMTFARMTPDISPFGVTEQIEHGLAISSWQMLAPLMVVLVFALPLAALAYVFLRNKEVAP